MFRLCLSNGLFFPIRFRFDKRSNDDDDDGDGEKREEERVKRNNNKNNNHKTRVKVNLGVHWFLMYYYIVMIKQANEDKWRTLPQSTSGMDDKTKRQNTTATTIIIINDYN